MNRNPFILLEAATGFEPVNNGFADRCLSHLAMPPKSFGVLKYWSDGVLGQLHRSLFITPALQHSNTPVFHGLERETGLEPATTTLATWGSTN
jgi:hypothetical protein